MCSCSLFQSVVCSQLILQQTVVMFVYILLMDSTGMALLKRYIKVTSSMSLA